jgi:surfactin synthase thioesterase subunit
LGAVELHNTVQQSMGVELPTTLVFDYPNIGEVSKYISGELKVIEDDIEEEKKEEILFIPSNVDATMRLYCLAYAGGICEQIFAEWSSYLPASIQVCPIELPGHGRRFHEKAFSDVASLAENLALNLPFDKPCAFFALSTGAIVMYETVMWLSKHGHAEKIRNIIGLFPAACPAPHLFPFFVQRMFASKEEGDLREITNISYDFDSSVADLMGYMDELPKETVLDVLEKTSVFSGIDKLRQSDDLYNFIMPGILCDSKLCLHYRPKNNYPLPMPIISLFGATDSTLGFKDVLNWRNYTSHEFKIFRIDGDHFFVNEPAAKLKTMHLVADHIVGIYDQFVKEQALQKQVPRLQNVMATSYESASKLCESTPIVLLISPGMSEEDVVQIRSYMSWTSRGVFTMSGTSTKPVAELAAEYLFQILSMNLQGPFIIIGWSAGAIVAYDLAVKLEQQSFLVDKLILMDGLHPIQLRDFGACALLPFAEKAQFVMQRVLQRHYMWPRFAKLWPGMTVDERIEEFLQIYSAIIGRDYGRDLFEESIKYMDSWWNFGALRPQEYKITTKLERGTLLYFRPMVRGGLPLIDDIFNIDFHHVIGWHEHCNNFQIVDVPGDHFTMLPSATFENLPFWRTVFKTFVEWHHHEGSILHNRLRAYMPTKGKGKGKAIGYYGKGKKKKALLPAATQPEAEQEESSFFKVGCFNLTPLKMKMKMKKKQKKNVVIVRPEDRPSTSTSSSNEESHDEESESNRQSMLWLRQKMNSSNVSKSDQILLEDFLLTIDGDALDELVKELQAANQVLSIETLTVLPERAQEILAEQLGISKTSISRMAKLSNRTTTLRIVIKSFLKTRK